MVNKSELLPCPFCGSRWEIIAIGQSGIQYKPQCTVCPCTFNYFYDSKKDAIKAVNRRA